MAAYPLIKYVYKKISKANKFANLKKYEDKINNPKFKEAIYFV